jgi:hypothetical protein
VRLEPLTAARVADRVIGRTDRVVGRGTAAWLALALLLAAGAAFILHESRGTTLWVDEWSWAFDRRGAHPDTWLEPHNEHLSAVPLALYRLLFTTAGLDDYLPYRLIGLAAHIACVVLLFAYSRRRVGEIAALLAAALLLLIGPAWQNILWPFQMGSLISMAAGVGALLLLDRGDKAGDAGACGLLGLSLASSGIGLPILVGAIVELAYGRRRLRDTWIAGLPLLAYGVWWLAFQETDFVRHNLVVAPGFAADAFAGVLSSLAGLGGVVIGENPQTLGWGRPLAVAAAAALAWRLARDRPVPARVLGLLAILVAFWVATALRRAQISTPVEGRYLYVGALFVLLLAAELARGTTLSRRGAALAAGLVAIAVLANLGDMRAGGRYLRDQAHAAHAVAGALELARARVPAEHVAEAFPGHPFLVVRAGSYYAAADAYGSPAASPEELAAAPGGARLAADAELIRVHAVELDPAGSEEPLGAPPAIDAMVGGSATTRGSCVAFEPAEARPAAVTPELQLTLPRAGLLLTASDGPVTVSVRRFADVFPEQPQATLAGAARATLRIGADRATQPWHVRLAPAGSVTTCGLR